MDFAWPEHRLAVEYEGAWHGEPQNVARDRARLNRLTAAGWRVVFVTAADVRRPARLLARIAAALAPRHTPERCLPDLGRSHRSHVDEAGPGRSGGGYRGAGRSGGTCRSPNTSRSATWAALSPQAPCTAGPGGVADEARYTPRTGVL